MEDNLLEINALTHRHRVLSASVETLESSLSMLTYANESFDGSDGLGLMAIKESLVAYTGDEAYAQMTSLEDLRSAIERIMEMLRNARRRLGEVLTDLVERYKSGADRLENDVTNLSAAIRVLEKTDPSNENRRIRISSASKLHMDGVIEPSGIIKTFGREMRSVAELKRVYLDRVSEIQITIQDYYGKLSSGGSLSDSEMTKHSRTVTEWASKLNDDLKAFDARLFNQALPGGQMVTKRDVSVLKDVVTFVPTIKHHQSYNAVNTGNEFILPSVRDLRQLLNALDTYRTQFERDRASMQKIVAKNRDLDRTIERASRRVASNQDEETYTQLRPHAALDNGTFIGATSDLMTFQANFMRAVVVYLTAAVAKYRSK